MGKKLRKEEWGPEKAIESALQLLGWQAELLRSALRQIKGQSSPTRPRQTKKSRN